MPNVVFERVGVRQSANQREPFSVQLGRKQPRPNRNHGRIRSREGRKRSNTNRNPQDPERAPAALLNSDLFGLFDLLETRWGPEPAGARSGFCGLRFVFGRLPPSQLRFLWFLLLSLVTFPDVDCLQR
jgi:hypothetical protein